MGISEAVSAKESRIDMTELRKAIGVAPTEFHGFLSESEENVIILSGLTMPYIYLCPNAAERLNAYLDKVVIPE